MKGSPSRAPTTAGVGSVVDASTSRSTANGTAAGQTIEFPGRLPVVVTTL